MKRPAFRGDSGSIEDLVQHERELREWEAECEQNRLIEQVRLVKAAEKRLAEERVVLVKNHGATILFGRGIPDSSDGVDGQGYIDHESLGLYLKINGEWVLITELDGGGGGGGSPGPPGSDGATGATGATGPAGDDGEGVPTGGTADQYLAKIDGDDFNTEWRTFEGEGMRLGSTGTLLANTVALVTFNSVAEEHPASSIFTFSNANDTITIGEDGLFEVGYFIRAIGGGLGGAPVPVFQTDRVRTSLELDTGGGFGALGMLAIQDWIVVKASQLYVMAATQLFEFSSGDIIRLLSGRVTGSISNTLQLSNCSLWIAKIK